MTKPKKVLTYIILVKGRVQGIGFRPSVYRLANKLKLNGFVKNTRQGVLIKCQGQNCERLIKTLKITPPALSHIAKISIRKIKAEPIENFQITKSQLSKKQSDFVQIMPDITICEDCVKDIEGKNNRRFFYPFTNCTQCGPRYSIIYDLPYDRPNTTMKNFTMCKDCLFEYKNPLTRRFHAQPNACSFCGPWLTLISIKDKLKEPDHKDNDKETILKARELLKKGKIIAIKSIGGFLIACDASNDKTVKRLRNRKKRPSKPFAIMCKDMRTIKKLCYINRAEAQILKSHISPIVLLKKIPFKTDISSLIAPKNGYFGVMLPYTPLHKLLFEKNANVSRETLLPPKTLIMTSANPKNAPIIADSEQIKTKLNGAVDYILDHNRLIESRCDDSIVLEFKGPVIIRRSRGYVPEPIFLKNLNLRPVLAFGSDYKNHFALGEDNKVCLSPYIGDLTSSDSIEFLFEMLEKYQRWFGIKPKVIVCDLHPDYTSRRLAEQYAIKNNLKLVKIQHHYAHLAGVMAEHGLNPPVIGIGFDGTGHGIDGAVWGSEIMVFDYLGFERVSHLKELPLIGGDVDVTNPKQIAAAYLKQLGISMVRDPVMIRGRSSIIHTTSMGRLFDAVSAILGVCQEQTFEGEAPIALQNEAMNARGNLLVDRHQSIENASNLIDPKPILEEVVQLKRKNCSIPDIALIFHKRIIDITVSIVKKIGKERKIKTVCLSGGVFQNKIILEGIYSGLEKSGFAVYINRTVPINDGGISFGQAVLGGINNPLLNHYLNY
jgi:hydrogenase maturation protein HypF